MLKQCRLPFILLATAFLGILISACGSTPGSGGNTPTTLGTPGAFNCVQGSLTTNGSTALGPLVQKVAADYQKKCSGATITTQLTGSGAGLTAVSGGNAQIGNSDVYATPTSKYPGLVDHQVAVIPFAVVINSDVTGVTNLTADQIKGIYTGQITDWGQVGGPQGMAIVPVSRPVGSGTRVTFEQFVLGAPETVSGANAPTASTTGDVQKTVSTTAGAISYIAVSGIGSLKPISIDGVAENAANIQNNTYKFWNVEHMYTKGTPSGLTQAFLDYMTSASAKQFASSLGFLDITTFQASTLDTRKPAGA